MNESDAIDMLKNGALAKSKIYNKGNMNYAFAFGYFASDITSLLQELNLSKKQLKIAEEYVNLSIKR